MVAEIGLSIRLVSCSVTGQVSVFYFVQVRSFDKIGPGSVFAWFRSFDKTGIVV